MVDDVEPWHDVDPGASISALSAGDTLHVLGQSAGAVDWLAALDFADHLTHVHVDFAAVFSEAIEAVCLSLVSAVSEQSPDGYVSRPMSADRDIIAK